MIRICFTLLLVVAIMSFTGEDAKIQYVKDIEKVYSTYANAENYACTIDVTVYDESKTPKPIEVIKALQKKRGKDYYYELGNIVYMMNKKYVITVNKVQKSIFIDKRNDQKIKSGILDPQMDSLMGSSYTTVSLFSNTKDNVRYTLTNSKAYISTVQLSINKDNWSFDEFVYKYNSQIYSNQKVVVKYSGFTLNPAFTNDEFSESVLITKQGDNFIGAGKYKNYIVFKNFM